MKNVIAVLVDSIFADCISNRSTKTSCTPFLDSIADNAIRANLYSYGPYTDAATKGLYCANRTLDDFGYYFSINGSKTDHFRIFKQNGYETYGEFYPYYIIGDECEKNIDHFIFTSGYYFPSVWFGKLKYYAEIKKENKLTSIDYKFMTKCLDYVFEGWISFYKHISTNSESSIVIEKYFCLESINDSYKKLSKEYKDFCNNKISYINQLLDDGENSPLFKVENFDFNSYGDKTFLKDIYIENKDQLNSIHKINKHLNIKNNKLSFKRSVRCLTNILRTRDFNSDRYLVNYYFCLNSIKRMEKHSLDTNWEYVPSANTIFNTGLNVLNNRDKNKPFYLFMHIEDAHERIAFFSYDTKDKLIVKNEIKDAYEFAKSLKKTDFKGNLLYYLSIKYIDNCLKDMFKKLKEMDLLDDTVVMLVADHGSSYNYYPLRKDMVNNFNRENYNIPLFIWSKEKNIFTKKYDEYYQSADAFATLYELCGLKTPDLVGKPLWKKHEDHIITEYMGPGLPDMTKRPLWMSIRNKKYCICIKAHLSKELTKDAIKEIYDLENDKLENNNIVNSFDYNNSTFEYLFSKLKERFDEIKRDTNSYCKTLMETNNE